MAKIAVFAHLKFQNLISHKIWVLESENMEFFDTFHYGIFSQNHNLEPSKLPLEFCFS